MDRRDFLTTLSTGAVATLAGCAGSGRSSKRWSLGCFTRPWSDFDLFTAMDEIAAAGFKHIGLMTTAPKGRLALSLTTSEADATKMGEEALSRGLNVAVAYVGDFPLQGTKQQGIDGLRKLIDLCVASRCKTALLGGTGKAEYYDLYYGIVAACCDEAQKKGIQLVLKPHGGLNSTGQQCRKTIESVNHANFRLWYDPGNIYYYSDGALDPVADVASVDGIVTGMCVKDYQHPKIVEITPGTGLVRFPAVWSRLVTGGFSTGPLIIECLKKGTLAEIRTEAITARIFLERLLA
jgi:sugar phosphate isomerase/epimerase